MYEKFLSKELDIDLYRSNDIVQFEPNSIYIRPFVKIGEPSDLAIIQKFELGNEGTRDRVKLAQM